MLLWLFKQLARGSYRDWLLIETPRLAGLGCGWERLISLLPRVQMQPQSPPSTPPSSPHATHKHTNTKHRHTHEGTSAYSLINLADSTEILRTRQDQWSTDESFKCEGEKKESHRILKWRHGTSSTALLFSYLHAQLWSPGPGACVWGVMRRGPRRRDKRKSDGGQAAASLAALTDLTHHPPPPPSSPPLRQAVQDTVCLHKVINNLAWADMD